MYFTATFPYLVLLVLFINGIMLDGAIDGIKFLFQPKWEQVLDVNVSIDDAQQNVTILNFNDLGEKMNANS